MGGDDADKLARTDDLRLLPELRKIPQVAGYEVIGTRGIGAFHEDIVVGIAGNLQRPRRRYELGPVLYELDELLLEAPSDFEFDNTSRYSRMMGAETYIVEGLVRANSRTVRCNPSGFSTAETRMLVSTTSRRGSISASSCAPAPL
jgi:hypothetical protein